MPTLPQGKTLREPGEIARGFEQLGYITDPALGTAVYLAVKLGKPLLLEGSPGSIVGAANFITPQLRAVYDAIQADDIVTARAEWLRIFPVMQFLVSGGYVAAVRGALDILGYPVGPARAPILGVVPHTGQPTQATHGAAKALGRVGPTTLTFDAGYERLIDQYLTDVAADSGGLLV